MGQDSRIDPICGMTGKIPAHGKWFCSAYCVRKYESEKGLNPVAEETLVQKNRRWTFLKNKLFLTFAVLACLLLLSPMIPGLGHFRHHFMEFAGMVWIAVLLGFFIGGLIEVYIPRTYIIKVLAGKGFGTILNAAVLGFIFSGCSHGCLAISFELYAKGASVPAVVAFLIASPWANMGITFLLFSFFGLKGGLVVAAALLIAVATGRIYIFLDRKDLIEKNPNTHEVSDNFSILADLGRRWKEYRFNAGEFAKGEFPAIFLGAWHLAQMVLWWIVAGMMVASLLESLVPSDFFVRWMGKDLLGMTATLGMATVIEVCSEGSAPLAFEIYRQTHAFGNVFIFLMAGVITDYTEIGLLWSTIGRRTALWLPVIAVPMAMLFGALFNFLF